MSDESALAVISTPNGGLLEAYQRYDLDVARRVIDAYANGTSLRNIAKMPGMPSRMAIWLWEKDKPEFCTALAHARGVKAEFHAERPDERFATVNPDSEFGSARVSLAREWGNYDKWLAGCLDPARYAPQGAGVTLNANVSVLVAFTDAGRGMAPIDTPADAEVFDKPPAQVSAFEVDRKRGAT